jgi:PPIC-type PPIASE domain.
VILAVIMAASMTACGGDGTWAVKTSDQSVPIGAYIYFLYSAYSEAQSKATDTTKSVLDQQIDGKKGDQWIKDRALSYTKSILYADKQLKDMNLSLTSSEESDLQSQVDASWSSYQSTLEGYGISKTSFSAVNAMLSTKFSKLFNAIYSKGGTKEVTDAQLQDFFVTNYTNFSYIMTQLYKTDTSGQSTAMTDDEKTAAKKKLDDLAVQINAGTLTVDKAAEKYKTDNSLTEDPLGTALSDLNKNSEGYPTEIVTALKAMKNGEAKTVESSSTYFLIVKGDINAKVSELATDSERASVLNDMKSEEFLNNLLTEADKMQGITVNSGAVNKYQPTMFNTSTSSK